MDDLYDNIDLFKIRGAEHTSLKGSLSLSDNLDVADISPLMIGKHRLIEKTVQYSPVLFGTVCTSGSITMEIDFKEYTVNAGDVLIVTHKQIGKLNNITPDLRYLTVAVDGDFYADHNINNSDANREKILLNKNSLVHLPEDEVKALTTIYQIIKRRVKGKLDLYDKEVIKGLVQTFFFNIFSEISKKDNILDSYKTLSDDSRQQSIYISFLRAVEEHCRRERSVGYYADMLCITPKYLSLIINKVSGRFAGDFIRDAVIHEAKALIRSKKYSMIDISVILNFSTQSSFTRFFKNATGLSPQEYQNKCGQTPNVAPARTFD